MHKFKLLIIFWLWILLGVFWLQLGNRISQVSQPIMHSGKFDLNSLISSISSTIDAKKLNLTPTLRDKYERFETVYEILQESYYDQEKLDSGVMIQKAVKAFVDAIDDPYTVYMDSEQNSGFQEELKGESDFEGIGAVVTKKDYYIMIEEVIKSSPAYNAGLMALDRNIFIDTGSTKDLTVNQAVAQIRGPKWTKVTLTIERAKKSGEKELLEKEVTRDKLLIPSVTTKIFTLPLSHFKKGGSPNGQGDLGANIGYINISIIGEETENILKKEIANLKKQYVKWIILDLRGNGWGLLPIAVEICSHFVPEDEVIVTAKYKSFDDEIYTSKGYGNFEWLPVIVLIDGLTASAGEIIALALQEDVGAKLVGVQSFGKWSIQTMDEFTDNASLKYTIGKRYAPKGKNIDKVWVTPDITVEFNADQFTKDRTDNQLEAAKTEINKMTQ